jgi:hypothetical protein
VTDLRDDLAPLLELATTPIEQLAERRRHRRARRRLLAGATCAVLAVLVGTGLVAVAGGGDDDPATVVADDAVVATDDAVAATDATTSPPEPTTTAAPPEAPAQIVVRPSTARPGEIVDLFVPGEAGRGVLFTLARWDGAAWEPPSFGLTSDGQGSYDCGDCPSWVAGAGPYAVDDIGIGGPGPDRVEIPDVAPPGRYRVCTGNAQVELCGQVEVAGTVVAAPDPPPAEHEPPLVTTSRSLLRPGERFELGFPTELPRSVMFTLAMWDGEAWADPSAQLHSSAAAYDEPRVEVTGATSPGVQVTGHGPDPLVLPSQLAAGWYRVCAGGIAATACVQVRVLDPLPDEPAPTMAPTLLPTTAEPPPSTTAPSSATDVAGPPPEPEPVALVVSPDVVWAGSDADLWFPTAATRGIPFLLQQWDGGAWADPSFVLYSDWGGDATPYWEEGGSPASRLPAFSGLGPDRVIIPDIAEPGTYRVCAWPDGPCGQLEIRQPPESSPAPLVDEEHRLAPYHCGIEPTEFAGDTWVADPVPFDGTNAPPDATVGTMTELQPDEDEARYVGSDGTVVRFVRLEGEWEPPPCL